MFSYRRLLSISRKHFSYNSVPDIYQTAKNLITIRTRPLKSNCYILSSDRNSAAIIDPGGNGKEIISILEKKQLNANIILCTHAHIDHIGVAYIIQEKYKAKCYLHPDDYALIMSTPECISPRTYCPIKDSQIIEWEDYKIKVIHTPGHSPGGCCFLFENGDKSILFSGDTLFRGVIGRTDILYADDKELRKSIKEKLLTLNENVIIYPGHGKSSTIGYEKTHNVFN